jgi:hypothetical protein
MLSHTIGDLNITNDSASWKILFSRQPPGNRDGHPQTVLRISAGTLKELIVLLPHNCGGMDQNAPAMLG